MTTRPAFRRIGAAIFVLVSIILAGCTGSQDAGPSEPTDPPAKDPVLLEETTWDLNIEGGAHVVSVGNVGTRNANCVEMRQFTNTNITSISAEVTYTETPSSAPEYRLSARLSSLQFILGEETVIGSERLELHVDLAEFWENRSDDLRVSLLLWPHGDTAWAVNQPFQMTVRVVSTTPEDQPPLSNRAGCAG